MGTAPTLEATASIVRALLADIIELPFDDVAVDADLKDELEADSLHQLELMAAVEDRFDIRLDVEDWSGSRTVSELAARTRERILASSDDER